MLNNKCLNFLAASLVAFSIGGCASTRTEYESNPEIPVREGDVNKNKVNDYLENLVSTGKYPVYPFEYNPNLPSNEQALVDVIVQFNRPINNYDLFYLDLMNGEYDRTLYGDGTEMRAGLPKNKLAKYAQIDGVVWIEGNYEVKID
ncbi:hypothetical protein HZA97_00615 [Candidatus Woesearchaeota archaeon]|nr:hypothetical protein [Candidatus Woesearchaeota archaeon]